MIVFINSTGKDEGWSATGVTNAAAVAVYLTNSDKEQIAKMDDQVHVLMEARPAVPRSKCAQWPLDLARFGSNFYRSAIAALTGQKGMN